MSISEFFNRKSRALYASLALAFGMAGGMAGHEIAKDRVENAPSNYTVAQAMAMDDNLPARPAGSKLTQEQWESQIAEQVFKYGRLPDGVVAPPETKLEQVIAVETFTARIDELQLRKAMMNMLELNAELNAALGDQTAILKSMEFTRYKADTMDLAISFVNDLRVSQNVSEQDYAAIVRDYNARVGLDVTANTGNWQKGIGFQQESNLAVHFGAVFGGMFGDDEDQTPQQLSREVGESMAEAQAQTDMIKLGAGAGAGALAGLLFLPLALRRRHPKVPK